HVTGVQTCALPISSLDHGNVVGIEVADHQLAAIRLEGQVHGCAANVHRGQELGVFQVHGGNFACTRASDKSLAAVLEYRNVFGLLTDWHGRAHGQIAGINQ